MKEFFRFFKKFIKEKPFVAMSMIGILYFIGICSIAYPMVSNVFSLKNSQNVITDYVQDMESMSSTEIAEKIEKAEIFNKAIFKEAEIKKEYAHILDGKDGLMCYVDIPKVSIYLPVYYGTSDEVLEKGCGYLENTSLPIGGINTHSVISGHTGLPSADMFTRLDELKKGDIFSIHILDKVLTYQVENINTVTPNAVEELYVREGKDYVTLLTCTPYGINDKRLLVRGERIFPEQEEVVTEEIQDNSQPLEDLSAEIHHDTVVIVIFLSIAVIVFLIACIILFFRLKR